MRPRSRGQALVELALILPFLILLVAGAVDLGRVWYSQITITNAAREGAMEAAVSPTSWSAGQPCDASTNRVMCRTLNEASDSWVTVTEADVSLSCSPSCSAGTWASPHTVTVEVQGHFSPLIPLMSILLGGSDVTLSASASATIAMAPTLGAVTTSSPSPSPTPSGSSPSPSPSPSASSSGSSSPTATPTPSPVPTPVACSAPSASFSVSPLSGKKNKTEFVFTDLSLNMHNPACNPIWSWNFGDGSGASSAQHPTHIFTKRDTYTVTLVVSNDAGSSQFERDVVVTN
jgi:PKD repeat protein